MEPAHPDMGFELAGSIRPADRKEISISYGIDESLVAYALAESLERSDYKFSISHNKTILGLWGYGTWGSATHRGPMGYVWLVSHEDLFGKWAKTMTRTARKVIFPKLDSLFPVYGNTLLMENHVHREWLRRAGFHEFSAHNVGEHPFVLSLRGEGCVYPPQVSLVYK